MDEELVQNAGSTTEQLQSQNAITAQESQGVTTQAASNVLNATQSSGTTAGIGDSGNNFQYNADQFNIGNYGNYASQMQGLYNQQWQNYQNSAQNAYDQNRQDLLDYQANVPKAYQQQANQLGVQQQQNQKNYGMYAQYNGINTGSASQSELALQNTYAQQQANIATERANAEKDAAKAVVDLETSYRNQLAEALGNYQYEFAQSIYNLMQNQDTYKQAVASTYAQYGDFSLYKDLGYSDDVIAGMQLDYITANPDGANATNVAQELVDSGRMTEAQIYSQTGISVNGYRPASSGGSFYTSWYWTQKLGHDPVYSADGGSAGGYSSKKSASFKNGNYTVDGVSYKTSNSSTSSTKKSSTTKVLHTTTEAGSAQSKNDASWYMENVAGITTQTKNGEVYYYKNGVEVGKAGSSAVSSLLEKANRAMYADTDWQKSAETHKDVIDAVNVDNSIGYYGSGTSKAGEVNTKTASYFTELSKADRQSIKDAGYSAKYYTDADQDTRTAILGVSDSIDTVKTAIELAKKNGYSTNLDVKELLDNPQELQKLIQATATKENGIANLVPKRYGDTRTEGEILADIYEANKLIADGNYMDEKSAEFYKAVISNNTFGETKESVKSAERILDTISSDWRENGIPSDEEIISSGFTPEVVKDAYKVYTASNMSGGFSKEQKEMFGNAIENFEDYSYVSKWLYSVANNTEFVDEKGNKLQAPTEEQKLKASQVADVIGQVNSAVDKTGKVFDANSYFKYVSDKKLEYTPESPITTKNYESADYLDNSLKDTNAFKSEFHTDSELRNYYEGEFSGDLKLEFIKSNLKTAYGNEWGRYASAYMELVESGKIAFEELPAIIQKDEETKAFESKKSLIASPNSFYTPQAGVPYEESNDRYFEVYGQGYAQR